MKIINLFIFLFLFKVSSAFYIVGYLPSYRFYLLDEITFSNLTHVMISFVNPNGEGNFSYSKSISSVIDKARPNGCKVFVSIGGGGLSDEIEHIYREQTKTENRAQFISNLMRFVREKHVDGIDVDLEGSMVQMSTYNGFVKELIDSAHAFNIEVSAAFAKWTGASVDQSTIEKFDFINLMSYDYTGPWSTEGQHAPMSQVKGDFNYWKERGAQPENLVVGLPFYGYQFDAESTSAKTWCEIVNNYPDSLNQDEIVTDEGTLYFNGKMTIQAKLDFIDDNNAGGAMIWELGQDCFNEQSMLSFIIQHRKEANIIENQKKSREIVFFPNPSSGVFNTKGFGEFKFEVYNLKGELLESGLNADQLNLEGLSFGVYLAVIEKEGQRITCRLVIQ